MLKLAVEEGGRLGGDASPYLLKMPTSQLRSLLNVPGYEVHEEIARGGMGIVYRASQLEPRREVALKMLLPHQVASPGMLERFRFEARAIAALEHPAILPVHHVGEHNGLPFFTMKLAAGGTLAQRKKHFAGNWRGIAELVATLADAVQFAHERGVLHRDLKPGNVLFDEAARVYVSDFGLAKLVGKDSDLTRSIDLLGTPHYVSPEVAARSAKDATTASDIYSLGAILYELLAGRPPFEAEGIPALLKKIADEEPAPPSRAVGTLSAKFQPPRDLEVICLKCLAKDPSRRYATAGEVANDLRRWLAGEPILARQTSMFEKLWLWSRRHRITATLIAAVFVLLVALLVGLSVASVRIAASQRHALRTVEALEARKANDLLAHDNTAEAIALLARRVRSDPDNWADVWRLMWALQRRRWAVPARPPVYPFPNDAGDAADRTFLVRGSDRGVLALYVGTNVVVHDVLKGTNVHVWPLPFLTERLSVAGGPGLIVAVDGNQQAWRFDFLTGQTRGRPVPVLRSPIRLDPSGKRGFAVAPDGSGQLLDLQTGASQTLVPATDEAGRAHSPSGLFLFPDGRQLAFTDRDRTVRIFDCVAGTLTGHVFVASDRIAGFTVSLDRRVMVTQSSEAIQFWDMESGRELLSRPEVGVSFKSGAFRPGTSQFYQGGNASGLVIFQPLNGQLSKLPARGMLLDGHCKAELNVPVTVRFERFVGIYDPENGQPLCQPIPVAQPITSAPRMVNGLCAILGFDGQLTLWEVKTNRFEPMVFRHKGPIQHASFSPDGQRFVTASHDGTAQVWDANTGEPVTPPLKHGDKVWLACFSPDGKRVATASWDASARIWDAATGAPLSPPLKASSYVFHVEFNPNGSKLLACGEDGAIRIYDSATGKPLLTLPEVRPVYWAHFSPDGRTIVTRPMLAKPKLWNVENGKLILELDEPGPYPRAAGVITRGDFSQDGSWLALGSPNRYATLWHLPDGKLHAVLNHIAVVRTASFSPDAQTILTTADDLTGQFWDLKTGQPISSPLAGQRRAGARPNSGNSMRAAAIHPDGRRAVTGGSDAAMHIWNVQNGLPLGEPAEFEGSVMHAEFSPDSKRVLLACFDGTAHVVPLPPVFERAPDWLAPLAEALVGQRFDSRGAAEIVSPTALWEVCERIRRASPGDEHANWARGVLGLQPFTPNAPR